MLVYLWTKVNWMLSTVSFQPFMLCVLTIVHAFLLLISDEEYVWSHTPYQHSTLADFSGSCVKFYERHGEHIYPTFICITVNEKMPLSNGRT